MGDASGSLLRDQSRRDHLGLVWRRHDFRETSRLITFLTPNQGRVTTLGKGAHRPGSQCLGRIDFLNLVEVRFSGGTLPVLHRIKLLHEHRQLREPSRFLAAGYLVELFDSAFLAGRPDPELFDLLSGGLRLLERCRPAALRQILLGIELRFLGEQGLLPSLTACAQCGTELARDELFSAAQYPGLACRSHARDRSTTIPPPAIAWLRHILRSPGRNWPTLPPAPREVDGLLGRWVNHALQRQPRNRRRALRVCPSLT